MSWQKDKRNQRWWLDGHDAYVQHCGHPTAIYPYYGVVRDVSEWILAPNGMAFMYLKHAQRAVELLLDGQLHLVVSRPGKPHRAVSVHPRQMAIIDTWRLIDVDNRYGFQRQRKPA